MAGIAAAAAIAALGWAPQTVNRGAAPDQAKLAKTLVVECGGFQPSDIVLIEGGSRDIELLENLAIEVRKLGGEPMISIGSDRLSRAQPPDVHRRARQVRLAGA
ncbi:MAG: hypothetical protein O2819_09495 [Planctomycetota bacterium]|nr:hypothetical protein [Planctomycetota bacterium]MDA1106699.1 hypothetical protein [Planctomycetota bacterium]